MSTYGKRSASLALDRPSCQLSAHGWRRNLEPISVLVGSLCALLLGVIIWSVGARETHVSYDPVRSLSSERGQLFAYTDPWRLQLKVSTRNRHSQFIGSPVVPYLGRIVRVEFDDTTAQLHVAYEHGDVLYRVRETSGRIRARIVSIKMNDEALGSLDD